MLPLLALVASVAAFASARPSNPLLALERRAACTKNGLVFDPPTLSLDDTNFEGSFTVKLAAKPEGNVDVYLDASNILFSDAVLKFDSSNWNKDQKVSVIASPNFYGDIKTETIKIEADIDAPCDNLCPQDYTGSRTSYPGQTCGWTGDPHITTFDSIDALFIGQGIYHYVQSEHLNVQATWAGAAAATCTGAVAVRYGDSAVILSIASDDFKSAHLNGKKLPSPKLQKITDSVSGITWTPQNGDGSDTWVITLADGSSVHVTHGYGKEMNYMDVSVFLAAGYYGKCGGLCNQHHSAKKGDGLLHGLNGGTFSHKSAADITAWGKTWEVAAGDSLFHSHYTPGTHTPPVKYTPVKGGKCPQHHTECPAKTTPATSTAAPAKTTTTEPVYQPPAVTSTAAASKTTLTTDVPAVTSTTAAVLTTTTTVPVVITTTAVVQTTTTQDLPKYTPSTCTYVSPSATSTAAAQITTTVPAAYPTSTAAADKSTASVPVEYPSSSAAAQSTSAPAAYPSSAAATSTPTTCIGTVTNPVTNNTYPIIQPPAYVPPADTHVAAAESHCTEILATGCEKVLPDVYATYLAACVADILSTGSYVFCETTRRSYNQRCAKVLGQMATDADPTVAAAAAEVHAAAGYNNATCPNSCSGNGVCDDCGCKCAAPFTGVDCAVDMTKLAVIPAPVAGATGAMLAGQEQRRVRSLVEQRHVRRQQVRARRVDADRDRLGLLERPGHVPNALVELGRRVSAVGVVLVVEPAGEDDL
ncbi:hypothetical protein HK101_000550 [Irineochytrium annulatum]|nr:hypothetical protein HK101_000550 [Irineochytrium annulatum]